MSDANIENEARPPLVEHQSGGGRGRLRWAHGIELIFAAAITLMAMSPLWDFSPGKRLAGDELSYLINSGAVARLVFNETGALPLWNPLIGTGEPLFETPFSFALNPLMLLPILAYGAINGVQVAILIHGVLMAWGGWFLGFFAGMGVPGRVLLALLVAGSGSLTGALGSGFYQVGLSQVYSVWVVAGLVAALHPEARRWQVGLLAVAAMLLIFAGTFFYVVPTAITCGVIAAFHLIKQGETGGRIRVDLRLARRLALALILAAGLAGARLLPQAVHAGYVQHPVERFIAEKVAFNTLLSLYFYPDLRGQSVYEFHYHYIVWLPLLISAAAVRAALIFMRIPMRWRLVAPALLLIGVFTLWGQSDGDAPIRWLYVHVPLLRHLRFPARMLAAASPLVALVAALWVDQALAALWRIGFARVRDETPVTMRRMAVSGGIGMITAVLVVVSAFGAQHVLRNWERRVTREWLLPHNAAALYLIRQAQPNGLISFFSRSFHDYWAVYDERVRAAFGNPDYRALPVTPTLGTTQILTSALPERAVDIHNGVYMESRGFTPDSELNGKIGYVAAWTIPDGLPHAFIVPVDTLRMSPNQLTRSMITPVQDIQHDFDAIRVVVEGVWAGGVLVVQETAYPGWTVEINGQTAPLESVGGFIGVRLHAADSALTVVFRYAPVWFYAGCGITVMFGVLTSVYLVGRRGRIE